MSFLIHMLISLQKQIQDAMERKANTEKSANHYRARLAALEVEIRQEAEVDNRSHMHLLLAALCSFVGRCCDADRVYGLVCSGLLPLSGKSPA